MSFYGMNYGEVMSLPIKAFWLMNTNINRISAERDVRKLRLETSINDAEAVKNLNEELTSELGEVMKFDQAVTAVTAVRDEKGIQELKSMVL